MRVSDFHFDLPEDLIAQHPPATRGSSRMLVLNRATQTLTDDVFANLPNRLRPGDLLILNDSRVLPARLFATRAGLATQPTSPKPSGQVEVLLTEQIPSTNPAENLWRALVKPARKVHPGETLLFHHNSSARIENAVLLSEGALAPKPQDLPKPPSATTAENLSPPDSLSAPILMAQVLAAGPHGERTLSFAPIPPGEEDFYARLTRIGHMPLPPYIRRDQSHQPDTPEDRERYQTVYSDQPGSAAAPTAGLHFTPEILADLESRGIEIAYLTLHVGLGTFQPIRVTDLADIRLHAERYTLPAATAQALNRALAPKSGPPRRIVAVGTTTTRTLEHIAHIAASQPTTSNQQPATVLTPHSGQTSIFLAPGHRFRIVSGLLTNFHLPESTLLMLAAAFAGDATKPGAPHLDSEMWDGLPQPSVGDPDRGRQTILAAYAHAIRHNYRFYSYGDCMLIL